MHVVMERSMGMGLDGALVTVNNCTSKWDSNYGNTESAGCGHPVNHVMHCFAGHLQLAPLRVRLRSRALHAASVHAATPLHSCDG
jgi:hypothetical protein